MYEVALDEAWELFGSYLSGARTGLVCACSAHPLEETARKALASSAAALGYGPDGCTFVALRTGVSTEEPPLDSQALFLLLEGLDPVCLVATDADTAGALARTYRSSVPADTAGRAFGRTVVAFKDFPAMLGNPQSKQQAWALLKKLPKFGER